ncbi:MAG: M48 family metalloprotease [Nitrososphaerales archaeon]|jgi:Zn-dependent protease with chaperone function
MDPASLYLRTFFGARPFASQELDSLAERMGVSPSQSPNPSERYFVTGARSVTAASLGNKVLFGRRYYERLSGDERLAVAAHEFAHMMDHDDGRSRVASLTLGLSLVLTFAALVAFHSLLLAESAFCASFLAMIRILSSRELERGRLQELRCDSLAASLVGGGPMISSIRLAESMEARRSGRGLLRRSRADHDPAFEERTRAIMATCVASQRRTG